MTVKVRSTVCVERFSGSQVLARDQWSWLTECNIWSSIKLY